MSEDYFQGLCDVQLAMMERQNAEINRLRREVVALKQALADTAPAQWEQQETITALELRIASMPKEQA